MTDLQETARAYASQRVALPGWGGGDDFECALRRPGLVSMAAAAGFVPNPLMSAVEEMFFPSEKAVRMPPEQQAKALYEIARCALVSPTMDELNEAGLMLTDEQYLAIYAFALKGVEGLRRFRDGIGGKPGGHGADVPREAVPDDRP
jgi:hypothetical protein